MIPMELINKGLVPYCGSDNGNSTGISLSDPLFPCMLEKYVVCDVCGLRSPSFEFISVLCVTPTYIMQNLIMQGMQRKY